MHTRRIRLFMPAVVLILLLVAVSTVGAATKAAPTVTLSVDQVSFQASDPVLITVTYINSNKNTIRILRWFTPENGLEEPVFSVKVDGQPAAYTGAFYKRPAAEAGDYVSLKSKSSIAYVVDLREYYDLSVSGEYEISFKASSYFLFSEKGNNSSDPDLLRSAPIALKVEGQVKPKPSPTTTPPPGGTAFNVCTTAQQAILLNARAGATTYASGAKSYLAGISSGTNRYLTWFGAFTTSRLNTVKSHFDALTTAWTSASVTFDCKCKQNYYAYVYPDRPYTIYLCKVFWQAPLTGTDSQSGTLIHEMSHFNVVAGTDDFVYGQTGAKSLAVTNPDNAINNADNHEYFAENNPPLQ